MESILFSILGLFFGVLLTIIITVIINKSKEKAKKLLTFYTTGVIIQHIKRTVFWRRFYEKG